MESESSQWHFNFRDEKKLPDLKVLQREFTLSLVAVFVAALLACLYVLDLMRSWRLDYEIYSLQSKINKNDAANKSALKDSERFQGYALVDADIQSMYAHSLPPAPVLAMIAQTVPQELVFNSLVFKEENQTDLATNRQTRTYKVTLEGFVQGTEAEGLATMNRFKDQIISVGDFKHSVQDFKVESLKSNDAQAGGMLSFVIQIQLKVP